MIIITSAVVRNNPASVAHGHPLRERSHVVCEASHVGGIVGFARASCSHVLSMLALRVEAQTCHFLGKRSGA